MIGEPQQKGFFFVKIFKTLIYWVDRKENLSYAECEGGIFMTDMHEIRENIVRLRKEQGLTQEEVAFLSDISVSRLQDLEYGCQNTTIDTLIRIAGTLGIDSRVFGIFSRTEKAILFEVRQPPRLPERKGGVLQICENIVLTRKARGLTQMKLACLSNISPACLRDMEHGCANVTIKKLLRVSDAFGLTLTKLNTLAMSEDELLESVRKARVMAGLRVR